MPYNNLLLVAALKPSMNTDIYIYILIITNTTRSFYNNNYIFIYHSVYTIFMPGIHNVVYFLYKPYFTIKMFIIFINDNT